jgi:hypothetical protein
MADTPNIKVKTQDHDRLAELVLERYRISSLYRSQHKLDKGVSVDTWIKRCDNIYNSIHDDDETAIYPKMRGYFSIGRIKVDAAVGWCRDLLADKMVMPWNYAPTPDPDLSENGKEQVAKSLYIALQEKLQAAGIVATADDVLAAGGGTMPAAVEKWLKAQRGSLRNLALSEQARTAENGCKLAQRYGKDWLQRSNMVNALTSAILGVYRDPCGIICGPYPDKVYTRTFAGNKYKAEWQDGINMRNVRCANAYFAPDSSSASDGGWFIEKGRRTRSELINMIDADGAIGDAIRKVLMEFEPGNSMNWLTAIASGNWSMGSGYLGSLNSGSLTWSANGHLGVDTIIMQGRLTGRELGRAQITGFDDNDMFEVEVEVCGNRTIRADVSNAPGGRSYSSTGFGDDDGPWKKSIPMALFDTQNRVNRIMYRRVQAVHQQSGAFYGVTGSAWDDPNTRFEPFGYGYFNPAQGGDGGRSPLQMFQPNPTFGKLYEELINELYIADTETAIPRFDRDSSGGGEQLTATESSIRYASAVRRQKSVAANLDKDIITLIGQRTYEWLLGKYPELRDIGDAMVDASGIVGGLTSNIQEARIVEALGPLTQAAAGGIVPTQFVQQLYWDYAERLGTDMRAWPNPTEADEVDAAIRGSTGLNAGTSAGIQPNTPAPLGTAQQPGLAPANSLTAQTSAPQGIGATL